MKSAKHSRFAPIGIEPYIRQHLRRNPDEKADALRARLQQSVSAALRGEPIWAIGSAVAGHACFTCITGEAHPSGDYEIDEVLAAADR